MSRKPQRHLGQWIDEGHKANGKVDWKKIESRNCPDCDERMPKVCYKYAETLVEALFDDNYNYERIKQACQNLIGACEDHSYEVTNITLTRKQALEQLIDSIGKFLCLNTRSQATESHRASKVED